MIFLLAGFVFVSFATGSILPDNHSQVAVRDQKVFNVLNVVKFPNDACTIGTTSGTCYAPNECTALGGQNIGACANGFGACCSFKASCGDNISKNNTYFLMDGTSGPSPCKTDVCRIDSNICQIRLDFEEFNLDQPVSGTLDTAGTGMYGDTVCQRSVFLLESDNGLTTPLCGNNKGYHMIVEAADGCNLMETTWTGSSTTRTLKILVSQIACDVKWKAPAGCTQWFTGVSNDVVSYNWHGGIHLAQHNYRACIRREKGMCSIQYHAASVSDFQISGTTASSYSAGSQCYLDYIYIPRGGITTQTTSKKNIDRFCGQGLGIPPTTGTTRTTIYTRNYPFHIGVVFDGSETVPTPIGSTPEYSKGFKIHYSQNIACLISN